MHRFILLFIISVISSCGDSQTTLQLECYGSVERLSAANDGHGTSLPHYRTSIRVYLRNTSHKSALVASSDPAWAQLRDDAKFNLVVTRPISVTGEPLSVSPTSYSLIKVPPNGCAFLYYFISVSSGDEPNLDRLIVTYSVTEDLGKELGIWSGKLQCSKVLSSMVAAEQKAAKEAKLLFGK